MFAARSASSQLPANITRKLQQLSPTRQLQIQEAIHTQAESDFPFTKQELSPTRQLQIQEAIHTQAESDFPFTKQELTHAISNKKDTAPGADKIPYSFINHLGPRGKTALLRIFNQSLQSVFPPTIFAYQKGAGTGDNNATLLSLLDGKDSIVVFLDLEKTFDLANKEAILSLLAEKGLRGRLLEWIQDYLTGRKAKVRFQGELSNSYDFENGTPQGGLLSHFLFNILISKLVDIPFPSDVQLLAYADDIQLVATGQNRHINAQTSLDLLENKCRELGLKVNSDKSKALQIRRISACRQLYIGNTPLEWVPSYKCLGIFFNSELSATTHLRFLLERTRCRLCILRKLTSCKTGAGFKVLRLFHTLAIRFLVDYSAPALLTLSSDQIVSLETIQNRAMRSILAAPRWTRLANLRVETYLSSLHTRIRQIEVTLCSKMITRTRPSPLKTFSCIFHNQDLHHNLTWHRKLAEAFLFLNTVPILSARGIDNYHPHYHPNPPWKDKSISIHTSTIPTTKALCTPTMIAQLKANIEALRAEDTLIIYTDGSVDQATGRSGAAIVTDDMSIAHRVSDGASTLQTELYAIKLAFRHTVYTTHPTIHIFTDSLSAIQTLKKNQVTDNLKLVTTILFHIQQLEEQGKTLSLWWIPSHVNISGNESAAAAAKNSLRFSTINGHITPRSPSANWYKIVTDYNPPFSVTTLPRKSAAVYHRLRLGYRCNWEIDIRVPRPCTLCTIITDEPLIHYILDCPNIQQLPQQYQGPQRRDRRQFASTAARCLAEILSSPDVLQVLTSSRVTTSDVPEELAKGLHRSSGRELVLCKFAEFIHCKLLSDITCTRGDVSYRCSIGSIGYVEEAEERENMTATVNLLRDSEYSEDYTLAQMWNLIRINLSY
ncbi:uncharacterized protein LOC134788316 [Penaeus indicus]|uniref:uncharacterized protein LOC134788316 n=1 Tax=Penaeus indicus TaxID=29960 RepID=UPI00300D0687